MKRFLIGFAAGVGLMYYYLHYAEIMESRGGSAFSFPAFAAGPN